jgi:vitamin B12/bleomycin/antimicrobial peptide transport system ATP-binding/permease protein
MMSPIFEPGSISSAAGVLRKTWRLARPYWVGDEKWKARGLLAAVVGLNLAMVAILVRLNAWNQAFYSALEKKDADQFQSQILIFAGLAFLYILVAVYRLYLQQMLEIRWRQWLTYRYLESWFSHRVYYRLELDRGTTDNPDQRIAEDVRLFVGGTLSLGLGLMSSIVTLVSFISILWMLSGPLSFALGGTPFSIPGYMVWAAVIYAVVGTLLTHRLGRRLIPINFELQRREADFRFGLVRIRENAEGVALYRGEKEEQQSLQDLFHHIRNRWWDVMRLTKRVVGFSATYGQLATIFPIVVAAPRYFSGALGLGGLMQISSAFGRVQDALSWLIDNYRSIAEWRATLDRLTSFLSEVEGIQTENRCTLERKVEGENLIVSATLALPTGTPLTNDFQLSITPKERVLIQGPSGSGKSTLFRTLAGVWPFARGEISFPRATSLFLPQKPYLPLGTLGSVLTYPTSEGTFTDDEIEEALDITKLSHLKPRLGESAPWQQILSPGEQQRIAIARALLQKPQWLFLDEATASVDPELERYLYHLLKERLPDTAILSIAHREGVREFHERVVRFNEPDAQKI